ncbi:lysylphosphatidylglycerol synthase domain-containing protein [Humibacillus xanthopallidus]|nr:lysylphosphatidylglycerol synthase domain-containing protein [Humibacillus xanthopallidus]
MQSDHGGSSAGTSAGPSGTWAGPSGTWAGPSGASAGPAGSSAGTFDADSGASSSGALLELKPPGRRRVVVSDVIKVGVALVALWWFARIIGQVDWSAVWVAVRDLAPLEILALFAVIAVRQTLNAGPLAIFVPSLTLRRAVANDLSANLIATVAPPPADIVLRISMLRSWGISAAEGVGGISLNTLTYYVARFGAPVLGLAVAFAAGQVESSFVWTAFTSGLVAAAVVAGLAIAARGARVAAASAAWVGQWARRVSQRVDPADWSRRAGDFVEQSGGALRQGSLRAMACQVGLVLSEALLLLLSLRFAGVPAGVASAVSIVVALLISYPLTALPFAGVGVLDAAVLTILGLDAGPWETTAIAGMVVFRVCWMLVPLALGGLTVLWWRHSQRGAGSTTPSAGEGPDDRDDDDRDDEPQQHDR